MKGKYPNRPRYNFKADLEAAAQQHGYPGPTELIISELQAGKTYADVGRMLGVTYACISSHAQGLRAKGIDLPIRPRGGNYRSNAVTVDNFILRCRHCGANFNGTSWDKVEKEMKNHKCKEAA